MNRPFKMSPTELNSRLSEMAEATMGDLQSQFLIVPKGKNFIEFSKFQAAYECLKQQTSGFNAFSEKTVWNALRDDSLSFVVLRTILGLSPPEWADLAKNDRKSDLDDSSARALDTNCKLRKDYLQNLNPDSVIFKRAIDLVSVAVEYIIRGAPGGSIDAIHRMDKVDTIAGLVSLQQVANLHVPYSMLLYERLTGRPFATQRDSVSGLVGDVMESAVEHRLSHANITYRKTAKAERISGFVQAPDFCVPTEMSPAVIIEAKIASDPGTARDKVARILQLVQMRNERILNGSPGFEIVACIDGRGFGTRLNDMEQLLRALNGKVFTLATLDQLIPNTRIADFLPKSIP